MNNNKERGPYVVGVDMLGQGREMFVRRGLMGGEGTLVIDMQGMVVMRDTVRTALLLSRKNLL